MFTNRNDQSNGKRDVRRRADEGESPKEMFLGMLSQLDVPATVRRHPLPSVAIAGGVGMAIGLTVGSRLVRMIIGSVGMYTVSELLKRYAKSALDEMKADEAGSPMRE
jgi:hypothetical protein